MVEEVAINIRVEDVVVLAAEGLDGGEVVVLGGGVCDGGVVGDEVGESFNECLCLISVIV